MITVDAAPASSGGVDNGLYGSSTLIQATIQADELTGIEFEVDAGLIALAYIGDTTGNGTLSSLDASRIQQQVVGLDANSFPDVTELLIG